MATVNMIETRKKKKKEKEYIYAGLGAGSMYKFWLTRLAIFGASMSITT